MGLLIANANVAGKAVGDIFDEKDIDPPLLAVLLAGQYVEPHSGPVTGPPVSLNGRNTPPAPRAEALPVAVAAAAAAARTTPATDAPELAPDAAPEKPSRRGA